jgi:hypothetical protein
VQATPLRRRWGKAAVAVADIRAGKFQPQIVSRAAAEDSYWGTPGPQINSLRLVQRQALALSRGFVSRMGSCCACFHHGSSPSLHLVLCSWKDTSGCVLHCKTVLGLLFLRDFFGSALRMFLAEWINCWELALRDKWFGFLGYEDVNISWRISGMKIQWFRSV